MAHEFIVRHTSLANDHEENFIISNHYYWFYVRYDWLIDYWFMCTIDFGTVLQGIWLPLSLISEQYSREYGCPYHSSTQPWPCLFYKCPPQLFCIMLIIFINLKYFVTLSSSFIILISESVARTKVASNCCSFERVTDIQRPMTSSMSKLLITANRTAEKLFCYQKYCQRSWQPSDSIL